MLVFPIPQTPHGSCRVCISKTLWVGEKPLRTTLEAMLDTFVGISRVGSRFFFRWVSELGDEIEKRISRHHPRILSQPSRLRVVPRSGCMACGALQSSTTRRPKTRRSRLLCGRHHHQPEPGPERTTRGKVRKVGIHINP